MLPFDLGLLLKNESMPLQKNKQVLLNKVPLLVLSKKIPASQYPPPPFILVFMMVQLLIVKYIFFEYFIVIPLLLFMALMNTFSMTYGEPHVPDPEHQG
jgi:hypothetical protein